MKTDKQVHTDFAISEAMTIFGGGFVSVLGKLWQLGDTINRNKLKIIFIDYWREYDDEAMHNRIKLMKDKTS